MLPASGNVVPYQPPLLPLAMPPERFNNLINANRIRLSWLKSHSCSCTFASQTPGSPNPHCKTCYGRGVWWDQPSAYFNGLITFIHMSPTPDEPGARVDTDFGTLINAEPSLTIGSDQGDVYAQASLFDQFVEVDVQQRFQCRLIKDQTENVPYQQLVNIPASGAVQVWDAVTQATVTGVPYTVSGTAIILGSGFPTGTNYIAEFYCAPSYVAYRIAGAPSHSRPFAEIAYPKRFRLQTLDFFTRARFASDIPNLA